MIATECPPPQGIPVQSQSHERYEDVLAKSVGALQHLCRIQSADHLEAVTLAQPGHLGALSRNTERDIGPNDGNVIEFGSRHKMFCELPKGNLDAEAHSPRPSDCCALFWHERDVLVP